MPNKNAFGIKSLREAAAQRVKESSLRAVAEEIGMGKTALHDFVNGSDPHSATREKLVSWYGEIRRNSTSESDLTTADVDAAISLLSRYVRRDSRLETRVNRLEGVIDKLRKKSLEGDV